MTTGIVGGGSCGRDVSSRSGIAKACAKTGTEETQEIRTFQMFIGSHIKKTHREKHRARVPCPPQKFPCFWLHIIGTGSDQPAFFVRAKRGGKTFIHPVIVHPHTDMTLPVCLGIHTHVETPQHNTVCPGFSLFPLVNIHTHPLSRHTWPAARLASVNPRWRSLNKREF